MVTVSLRFEEALKQQLDRMCEDLGMSLTTFFTIYAHAALREHRIPFELRTSDHPFYAQANVEAILRSEQEAKSGLTVSKTLAELRSMEDE